jgi:diguanylate cyclase (GGDEF)-like protein
LLRRAGEVLNEVVRKPHHAARIGGDEFAILMCAADERDGEVMIENINRLVEVNNQFYSGLVLGLSMGLATSRPGERLEAVARRADVQMFKAKRDFYSAVEHDRPQSSADA